MTGHPYTASRIAGITGAEADIPGGDGTTITELLIDSRQLTDPQTTLFVALQTGRDDGHRYIPQLMERGVRCFLVNDRYQPSGEALFLRVPDPLTALQQIAAFHRQQFAGTVIGITGSNGKTIVKEWLYQLLSPLMNIIRSPKSFNSRIGVPLAVWNIRDTHRLAILEAGISTTGEMERLEPLIRPDIGILTNIGSAHDGGFSSREEKTREKLRLFRQAKVLVYRSSYAEITGEIRNDPAYDSLKRFTWGDHPGDDLQVTEIRKSNGTTTVSTRYQDKTPVLTIPFTDEASVENALHGLAALLALALHTRIPGVTAGGLTSTDRFATLTPVAMRLELKQGLNNCSLINDTYNSDINSLGIALDFLMQQTGHPKRTLILSDILQSGRDPEELYREVARIIGLRRIDRIIGIGSRITLHRDLFPPGTRFFPDTNDFLAHFPRSAFHDETILLKGARPFGLERISQVLQQKAHETVLEINLSALVHNLNHFRAKLKPGVKSMAMVKAFAYGSGGFEVSGVLQFNRVDYLAVAYTDEGMELRKAGITLPILVMSPEEENLELLLDGNLEPEIYSLRLLRLYIGTVSRHDLPPSGEVKIHIKLDTGMHRLGLCSGDLPELTGLLEAHPWLRVASLFTHLAATEDPGLDDFTRGQVARFGEMCEVITSWLPYPVLRHVLNSAGISRFPDFQFDMVRLGIGLYGIGVDETEQKQLRQVSAMRSVIIQIKQIRQGETVGYNRRGMARRDTMIGVVPVGYADGLDRRLGNGRGSLMVDGRPAPLIGNICMDLCMIDLTDILASGTTVEEGDPVLIFGEEIPLTGMARTLDTIPYEIMTSVSGRVKRIYYFE